MYQDIFYLRAEVVSNVKIAKFASLKKQRQYQNLK